MQIIWVGIVLQAYLSTDQKKNVTRENLSQNGQVKKRTTLKKNYACHYLSSSLYNASWPYDKKTLRRRKGVKTGFMKLKKKKSTGQQRVEKQTREAFFIK